MPNIVNTSNWEDVGFNTNLTKPYGFTPGTGSSVLLCLALGDTAARVTSIDAGGYTRYGSGALAVGGYQMEFWIRNNVTGSPTTAAIILDTSTFALVAAFNFDDDITGDEITSVNVANSSTPTVDITAASGSAVIMSFVSAFARTSSSPIPSGFALLAAGSQNHNSVYDADVGAGGSLTVGCTMDGSNSWDAVALELTGAGGGGTSIPVVSAGLRHLMNN